MTRVGVVVVIVGGGITKRVKMIPLRGGGVTPHSEIIMGDSDSCYN